MTTANICSVVALGCDDLSVSVWQTKSARPLVVAKDAFERPVMDLSWYVTARTDVSHANLELARSLDGMTLYACSSDGTIGVFDFDALELEGIAPLSVQAEYLKLFNFSPPPVPQYYQAPGLPREPSNMIYSTPASLPMGHSLPAREKPPNLNMSGKKKRRIKPVFVSHLSGLPNGVPPTPSESTMNGINTQTSYLSASQAPQPFGAPQLGDPVPNTFRDRHQSAMPRFSNYADTQTQPSGYSEPERFPSHSSSFASNQVHQMDIIRSGSKMEALRNGDHPENSRDMWDSIEGTTVGQNDALRLPKARTLGGDSRREPMGPIKEIRPPSGMTPMDIDTSSSPLSYRLAVPALRNIVFAKVEERETDVFEGRNSEDGSCKFPMRV